MNPEPFMDVASALVALGEHHGSRTFGGKWSEKHWMNTPGPLYCGQTDNCGTGPPEAPDNVLLDAQSYEVIFKQPVNAEELEQVINAASCDPFRAYGADGNLHWSCHTIREWWRQRAELMAEVTQIYQRIENANKEWSSKTSADVDPRFFRYADVEGYAKRMRADPKYADVKDSRFLYMEARRLEAESYIASYKEWKSYIEQGLHQYLQIYAFFLDNGQIPTSNETLPDL